MFTWPLLAFISAPGITGDCVALPAEVVYENKHADVVRTSVTIS
ncbi:hypothetical protein [Niastella populi]|nr:hypothetical protein [Niastella populi]